MGDGVLVGVGALLALQFATLWRVTHVACGWKWTIGGFALYVALNGAFLWGCRAVGLPPLVQIQLGCLVLWVPLAVLMVLLSRDTLGRRIFVALDYAAYLTAILPVCHLLAFRKLEVIGGGGANMLAYRPRFGACGFPVRATAARPQLG